MAVNAVAPEQMSADQRLQEVISLLSAGFLRYRLRKAADGGETCPPAVWRDGLAILRTSSDSCVNPPEAGKPKSEGETR